MKARLEIIVEKDETPTEQLTRGVQEAVDENLDHPEVLDEIKAEAEQALADAGYTSAMVTRAERL